LIYLFFFAFVLIIAGLFISRSKSNNQGNWLQFYSKGKEAGFSIRELEQLKKLAVSCYIQEPTSIFNSQRQLEICIKSLVQTVRMSVNSDADGLQGFLSKLFDYYKKIELRTTDMKTRISSSRQISEGQAVRVLVPGVGVFKSEIVKNSGNSLTVMRPVNSKLTSAAQWNDQKVSIYFWRDDDAGYVFDTIVTDEVFSKGISSLKIEHCDTLFRTQKRKTMRLKYHKPAYLYLAGDVNENDKERGAGLNCMLEDISDTGCAYKVKGRASAGMRLKVQFALDKIPVCMPGTVRSVDYAEESNISLIHMESDALDIDVRNRILSEVFKMLPDEDEDELPFRVIEEETGAAEADAGDSDSASDDEELSPFNDDF
jgi:c-di-GMP-binding flagellar brake protein YcgR